MDPATPAIPPSVLSRLTENVLSHTARGASLAPRPSPCASLEARVRAHTRGAALCQGLPLLPDAPSGGLPTPASLRARLLLLGPTPGSAAAALRPPQQPPAPAPAPADAERAPAPRAELLLALADCRAALAEWQSLSPGAAAGGSQ